MNFRLEDNNTDNKNIVVAVALSGGKDSTTLLHKTIEFTKKNKNITLWGAIIINHNMRPESEEESIKIKNYWNQYKIRIHIICYKNKNLLRNQKTAREFRLNTLSLFALKNNIHYILLGHNLEDKLETYLLRLEKNSTNFGLASIGDLILINNIKFLRPLLHTSRAYIDEYIKKNNLFFIEDSSNNGDKYRRNYLRHHIINQYNKRELLLLINKYVDNRKNHFQYINQWCKLHLIEMNHFSYKFLYNRLPSCNILKKLIIAHIVHKVRGKPVNNWSNINFENNNKDFINFHLNNVTFNIHGYYYYVNEYISDFAIHRKKTIFFHNKLILHSNKYIECKNVSWPIIEIDKNQININNYKKKTNLIEIKGKKIKLEIIKDNFFSDFF